MTPEEYTARTADYRQEMAEVLDRWLEELGPTEEFAAYPEQFEEWTFEEIHKRNESVMVGWAVVVELFNPMDIEAPGYLRFMQPPMQSPAHTRGLLVQGESYLSP